MLQTIMRLHFSHASSQMPPRVRLRTAYHEAAHGYFMSASPLWRDVSIRLHENGGLASSKYNEKERADIPATAWLIVRMTVAGAVAENYFFGGFSKLGAYQDLSSASEYAALREEALEEYIYDNLLPTASGIIDNSLPSSVSLRTQMIISSAVLSAAKEISDNRDKIRLLGKALYKKSYLSDKEIRAILR